MTWPLRQKWFWMLFLMLLLVLLVPFLLIGLLANLSPSILLIVLIVLVAIWIINKSYRDWKRKREDETGEHKLASSQEDAEPATLGTSEPSEIECTNCGKMYSAMEAKCPLCGAERSLERRADDVATQT